jgi:hypothetical protein
MLDRYAYVRNNPLRYVDPTGLSGTTPPSFGTPVDWEGLRRWGDQLRSFGVPESHMVDTMINTARLLKGEIPSTSPDYYLSPSWKGNVVDYPLTQPYNHKRTNLEFKARVELGDGQVILYYKYEADRQPENWELTVDLGFSSGREVACVRDLDAEEKLRHRTSGAVGMIPAQPGTAMSPNQDVRVAVYSFGYSEGLGYSTYAEVKPLFNPLIYYAYTRPNNTLPLVPIWSRW